MMANSPQPSALRLPVSANQLEIQELGKFAVMEQNKNHHWDLTFNAVYEQWKMTLATNYGNLYLLHLKALNALTNDKLVNYETIVLVKLKGSDCDPTTVISFKEFVLGGVSDQGTIYTPPLA